jgi:hypothetical protein
MQEQSFFSRKSGRASHAGKVETASQQIKRERDRKNSKKIMRLIKRQHQIRKQQPKPLQFPEFRKLSVIGRAVKSVKSWFRQRK